MINLNDFLYELYNLSIPEGMCYNLDLLELLADKLKTNFPDVSILYAMKANSDKKILQILNQKGIGVDCASYEEFIKAKKYSFKIISCTGPGFKCTEIHEILSRGDIFDFDNINQLKIYHNQYGRSFLEKGIRISCDASHLGLSYEEILTNKDLLYDLVRLHIHFGQKNVENIKNNLNLLRRIIKNDLELFGNIRQINLGGSVENLYSKGTQTIANDLITSFKNEIEFLLNKKIRIILEPGDFLARPIGFFKTNILFGTKKNIIINSSILNFCSWYPKKIYTPININNDRYEYKVCGNSCFEHDVFGTIISYKKLLKNDSVILYPVGSYNFNINKFIHDRVPSKKIIYFYKGEFFEK